MNLSTGVFSIDIYTSFMICGVLLSKTRYIYSLDVNFPNEIELEINNSNKLLKKRNQLGKGTYGHVYHYTERIEMAIKGQSLDGQCFEEELELCQKLSHPNIIHVLFSFKMNKSGYIAFEYFPRTLFSILNEEKICLRDLKIIFKQLLDALLYLEGEGVIHNDIKLDNVVVDSDLNAKLIDFGLACYVNRPRRIFSPQNPVSEERKNLFPYFSPEVLKGLDQGFKSDIYSWGFMLRNAASGILFINPGDFHTDVTDICDHALQVDLDARPSVDELIFHPFFDEIYEFLFCFNDYEDIKITSGDIYIEKIGSKIFLKGNEFEIALYCGCDYEKTDESVTRLLNMGIHSEKCTVCRTGLRVSKYARFKFELGGEIFPLHLFKMKELKRIKDYLLGIRNHFVLKRKPFYTLNCCCNYKLGFYE
ncbi:protein kinase [Hamiltosporidium tvaerminnensis]|uniref:Protein kinase n=1 Tax=Hamiltosporidium tvaerminnensis TaxID=1176355 RepID=A0A4Q9KT77_9MICR|nr:protein kinase [Hamiltosporidium tvaerminnensis]